ncbi:MAG TPA: hypothetical protein VF139_17455 [Candidatus Polarisedimenticolaceae bacterium]
MIGSAMLAVVLSATPATVPDALIWAGRFADGLAGDAKDRERAQEAVVLDIAMLGHLDEAIRRADGVEGWRRGVAYAEIAKMLAKRNRLPEARALLAKAEEVASGVEGWQGPRIESHVAQARALVDGMDAPAVTTGRLEQDDALQYRGLTAVLRATAHAAKGEFDPAMAQLTKASQETAIEVSWPMVQAYLDLARHPSLTPAQRSQTLDAALAAVSRIPEQISRLDAMEALAEGYREAGLREPAVSVLAEFHAQVSSLSDATLLKAPFLAGEARSRARLGDRGSALEILADASRIGSSAYLVDRPAVLANVAAAYHVAGDSASAQATLDAALSTAEGLVNARPRALAFIEIGRVLARFDLPMSTPVRGRFERGLSGLKAPW